MIDKIGSNVAFAADRLRAGKVVAIPTETVYGLAANALHPESVARIFAIKQRPAFDPLIVHLAASADLEKYAQSVPEKARQLAAAFWPGPLTLVLPKKDLIPELVTAGLPTVGLRLPNHKLTLELLAQLDFPLAAPSANPFGYISPTTARHVYDQLGEQVDYILDGGPCTVGLESTIVGFPAGEPVLYRLGGIALEKLEAVIGKVHLQLNVSSNPQAPGQLTTHYAPRKPLLLGDIATLAKGKDLSKWAIISFRDAYAQLGAGKVVVLSEDGHLEEAAARLFQVLRSLDQWEGEGILAEPFPEEGLGRAINDRLQRAATHS